MTRSHINLEWPKMGFLYKCRLHKAENQSGKWKQSPLALGKLFSGRIWRPRRIHFYISFRWWWNKMLRLSTWSRRRPWRLQRERRIKGLCHCWCEISLRLLGLGFNWRESMWCEHWSGGFSYSSIYLRSNITWDLLHSVRMSGGVDTTSCMFMTGKRPMRAATDCH